MRAWSPSSSIQSADQYRTPLTGRPGGHVSTDPPLPSRAFGTNDENEKHSADRRAEQEGN